VTLAPFPLLHRSHDAKLLLSTAYPRSGAFSVWLDCRLVGVFPFSLLSRLRSLSFATIIWAARSSWLRRSEICPFRAFMSGMVFPLPSPPSRVLTALLFLCSLLLFFDSVPFSPTCLGYYPASTFSHLCSLQLSLKQCSQLVRSPWALLALR